MAGSLKNLFNKAASQVKAQAPTKAKTKTAVAKTKTTVAKSYANTAAPSKPSMKKAVKTEIKKESPMQKMTARAKRLSRS